MQFFEEDGDDTEVNPLEALDLLYEQIMSCISSHAIPATKLILAYSLLFFPSSWTRRLNIPINVAEFLGLEVNMFYGALINLHSVLDVPTGQTPKSPPRFIHNSFAEFLLDERRSGPFALDMDQALRQIAELTRSWKFCKGNNAVDPHEMELYQQCTALAQEVMATRATNKFIAELRHDKAQDIADFLSKVRLSIPFTISGRINMTLIDDR
jgi:hypothetical protein